MDARRKNKRTSARNALVIAVNDVQYADNPPPVRGA